MSPRWRQREDSDFDAARRDLAVERRTAKDLLHQASDLVIEIRVAAERMELILQDLAEEDADGTAGETAGEDVAGGGTTTDPGPEGR